METHLEDTGDQNARPADPRCRSRSVLVRYRLPVLLITHTLLFTGALFAAFLFAYNFRFEMPEGLQRKSWLVSLFLPLAALAVPLKLIVFHWARQYQSSWRYVGLRDLFGVISASLVASFTFLTAYFLLENVWELSFGERLIDKGSESLLRQSAVFVLDWAATIGFVCAAKVLVRFYYEDIQPGQTRRSTRALIVGAGDSGEAIVRQLLRSRPDRYICVGFLDNEVPHLHGRIHDVEIIGRTSQIREICLAKDVEEVFIALPNAGPRLIREMVEACKGTGVRFRTIPAVSDLIQGRVRVHQIRDVDITDLLRREPVELDTKRIGLQLRGRRVLVTGAGGSIGAEMCRQIAAFEPLRLILVEQAENALFEIDRELRARFPVLDVVPCVADVCDRSRIMALFERESPAVVFHAAAHKHVPMMELNPGEAIKNNIGGTVALADACIAAGVQTMVLISTDKAVNPTSIMGCSKRVAELYVQSQNEEGATQFITVRFGNVLGSSGSVVPIFQQQIASGGPVTVTDPQMTRYFMTIPEAAQLVLQAGTMGRGGEIYTLHMGEPVRIVDLAQDMITLSGLQPGTDVEIVYTGRRPGEKLYEELLGEGEHIGDTAHPKIGIWKHRPHDWAAIRSGTARLLELADELTRDQIHAEFLRLIPEYTPDTSLNRADTPSGAPVG